MVRDYTAVENNRESGFRVIPVDYVESFARPIRVNVVLPRREDYSNGRDSGSSYKTEYLSRRENRPYDSGGGTGNVLAGAPSKTMFVWFW